MAPHYDQLSGGHSEIEIKDLKVRPTNRLGGEGTGVNMGPDTASPMAVFATEWQNTRGPARAPTWRSPI